MKLVGGFVIVSLITLGVGLVGWNGLSRVDESVNAVHRHLLAVQHASTMNSALTRLKAATRTLLAPDLTQERREGQYNNIVKAQESFDKARKAYEGLPKESDEFTILAKQTFQSAEDARKENDLTVQFSREMENFGLLNPVALRANLEKFIGDHYRLFSLMGDALLSGTLFDGGDDHTQSAFGKWLPQFKSSSVKVNGALTEIQETHKTFHTGVKNIKDALRNGNKESALEIYQKEALPAARRTLEGLQTVLAVDLEAIQA